MCGIVGAASNYLSDPEKEVFKNLLYISALRGEDSTGVISIQSKANGKGLHAPHVKSTHDSASFLYHNSDHPVIFKPAEHVHALVGHTRSATVGKITKQNAHPFSFPTVIGVHNGTMQRKWGTEDKFGTDSEALYNEIDQHGIREVVKRIGRGYNVRDAYALVFFDRKEQTLCMIRNELRPLSITKTTGTVYWASEARMLDWAVNRENGSREIEGIKPYHLYTWKLGGLIGAPQIEDLTPPFKSAPVTVHVRSRSDWRSEYEDFWQESANTYRQRQNQNQKPKPKDKEIPMDGYVRVFNIVDQCWKLHNWMYPDRLPITLNDDASLPDGYYIKNGVVVPKEVTTSPLPVTPKPIDKFGKSEDTDVADPFDQVSRLDELFRDTGEPGSNTENVNDCKIIRIADRKPIRHTMREEGFYVDSSGQIIPERSLKSALHAGCVTCGSSVDVTDISDVDNNVLGTFDKNDTGGTNYTCLPCIKDHYDDNPELIPNIH